MAVVSVRLSSLFLASLLRLLVFGLSFLVLCGCRRTGGVTQLAAPPPDKAPEIQIQTAAKNQRTA